MRNADLLPQHARLLDASGIAPEVVRARGYRSVQDAAALAALGFSRAQQRTPALLIPIWNAQGVVALHQLRPDAPRLRDGKPIKYETPTGARMALDVPPTARPLLGNPAQPLFITEGSRKADAAASRGLCCIALLGVWNWRGSNEQGGKTALSDWEQIALNGRKVYVAFDSDVMVKDEVRMALARLRAFLEGRGARVDLILLPAGAGGAKVGLDDYFAAGHTVDALLALAVHDLPTPAMPGSEGHHLTDLGNTHRLTEQHGADLRYCAPLGAWYCWNGEFWQHDQTGEVMRRAKATVATIYGEAARAKEGEARRRIAEHATRSEAEYRLRAMVSLAESEADVAVTPAALDADPWALNVRNGTLDLRTGSLRPHRRDDLITRCAPVTYDPAARHEVWERFLDEVTAGDRELAAFLQRAVGYSLTGDTGEEVLFFVHGPAASGKSTFIEAIKAMLGTYCTTADFEAFLSRRASGGPRNDLARLAGARLVASIEVDEGKRLAEGLVKMITGGDTVTARFLHQEFFEYKPQFKLWLAANHAPQVRDDDEAMWRRILRLPFDHAIPKERRDPRVKATLRDVDAAGPAILAWAVQGCLEWQRRGLGVPRVVQEATEAYRQDMDPLHDFLSECCVLAANSWVSAATLRQAYETWLGENGLPVTINGREWAERLRGHGCVQGWGRERGTPARGWKGIGLRAEEMTALPLHLARIGKEPVKTN